MATKPPTRKRILRVPDAWPTWPFTKLSPEVMRALEAKLARRAREEGERQREAAREHALETRRKIARKP